MERHRHAREKDFAVGKAVLVLQTRMGQMPAKLRFRWTGLYWIVGAENGTFQLGTLAGEVLRQKVNGFRLKTYLGPIPPNPFHAVNDTAKEFPHKLKGSTCILV